MTTVSKRQAPTHHVPYDTPRSANGRRGLAACGQIVDITLNAKDPSCHACAVYLLQLDRNNPGDDGDDEELPLAD